MVTTSWNLIQMAAGGDRTACEGFAQTYEQLIRRYLGTRWQGSPQLECIDDVVQEVFVECFRSNGVLQRAEADRPSGFRAFLYGVVRNVALRSEDRAVRDRKRWATSTFQPDNLQIAETSLSRNFDRNWAKLVLRDAMEHLAEKAEEQGDEAKRRVDLLRLRFQEGLSVKDIAHQWGEDVILLNRQHTRAMREFKRALSELLIRRYPQTAGRIEGELREIARLLQD